MNGVTMQDVAERAGVHVGTASRALDPDRQYMVSAKTRERVRQAADDLGYQVNALARGLRKGFTGILGVVVPDIGNPFLAPLLRGLEQVLGARGFMTLVAETHEDPRNLRQICEHLIARRVDGVIVSAAHQSDGPFLSTVAKTMPVVLAVRKVDEPGHYTVTHDDKLGAMLATEHLIDLGHGTVAQLRGPDDVSSFSMRTEGFGKVVKQRRCRDVSSDETAVEPTIQEGRRLAERLLKRGHNRPTAIFAQNDLMAIGALEALAEAGLRCPEDMSIVGYNDAPLTRHLAPPLTSVRLPSSELGQRAGALMLAQLAGTAKEPTIELFPPELVVRASTSRATL